MNHDDVPITRARATVRASSGGGTVQGTVTFVLEDKGVRVLADLAGLSPGLHGFHVHEYGDCADAGKAAGAHFNPMHTDHGSPNAMARHAGDMGNITADGNGHAVLEYLDEQLSFSGASSIIGRSVVVHKNADDLKTQPSGASGERIGCGEIGYSK